VKRWIGILWVEVCVTRDLLVDPLYDASFDHMFVNSATYGTIAGALHCVCSRQADRACGGHPVAVCWARPWPPWTICQYKHSGEEDRDYAAYKQDYVDSCATYGKAAQK